ncbi:hypothetical protein [Escherichia coli]|uniref:hypothetical protein n=1 Tax=Escherichia coli TaxID=562 RepID=UPI0012FFF33E
MDSDETHEMYSAGIISRPEVRRSGGDGERLPEHGVGPHRWLPGQTGNSLSCKEQSIASGVAGGTVAKDSGVVIIK